MECICVIGDSYKDLVKEINNGFNIPCKKITVFYKDIEKWKTIEPLIKDKAIDEQRIRLEETEHIIEIINQAIGKRKRICINTIGAKEISSIVLVALLLKNKRQIERVSITIKHPLEKGHACVPAILLFSLPEQGNKKQKTPRKIIELLIKNNRKLSMKEIIKATNRSKSTISEMLSNMEKQKIIRKIRKGRKTMIELNKIAEMLYLLK